MRVAAGRLVYVHVARGGGQANGIGLRAGDGPKRTDAAEVVPTAGRDAGARIFDLRPETRH